jgi:hypothetical protein
MDTALETAPAGAPESGIRQPAPDGRPASDLFALLACPFCGARPIQDSQLIGDAYRKICPFGHGGAADNHPYGWTDSQSDAAMMSAIKDWNDWANVTAQASPTTTPK